MIAANKKGRTTKAAATRPTIEEKATKLREVMAQCYGSENMYRHNIAGLIYTDGVKLVAEYGEAYWLIDAVASYQGRGKLARDPMLVDFQIWKLTVDRESRLAVLTCQADTGCPAAVRQEIEYTDFPLDEIKFYVERGGHYDARGNVVAHMTMMLPSER